MDLGILMFYALLGSGLLGLVRLFVKGPIALSACVMLLALFGGGALLLSAGATEGRRRGHPQRAWLDEPSALEAVDFYGSGGVT